MNFLYNERLIPLTLLGIIVILGLTLFSVNDNLLGLSGEPNQPVYATNKDFFTQETIATIITEMVAKRVTLSDNFPQATIVSAGKVALTIRTNAYTKPRFTHKQAYVSYRGGAWQTISLEPASSQSQQGDWNDVWIRGPAQGIINLDLADDWDLHTAYLVTYSCTLHSREDITTAEGLSEQEKTLILTQRFGESQQAYLCGFDEQKILDKWNLIEQTINIGTPLYIAGFETQQATTSPGEEVTGYWYLYGAGTNHECMITTNEQVPPEIITYDHEHGFFSFVAPTSLQEDLLNLTLVCENEFHKTSRETSILIDDPTTPTNAVCGSNNQTFTYDTQDWPSNDFCAQGTIDGFAPDFPEQGSSVSWDCLGENTGDSMSCSARREGTPIISCADRTPPGLIVQQAYCNGRYPSSSPYCTVYSSVFGSVTNPFPGNRNIQLDQFRDNYYAMEFTVPQSGPLRGTWSFATPQYGATYRDAYLSSISRCPGDFDTQKIEQEIEGQCVVHSSSSPFRNAFVGWAIAHEGITLNRCQLERGETYYLNFFFTNATPQTPVDQMSWICQDEVYPSACGWAMMPNPTNNACQSNINCQDGYTCQNGHCMISS